MSTCASRLCQLGWLVCAAIAVVVVSGCSQRGLAPEPGQTQKVMSVNAEDRLPNRTAGDLVTYADHVVLVTVTAERPIPPSEEEIARGEGIVMRDLTMEVDDVLWSSPNTKMPAPENFHWNALGWSFKGVDPSRNQTPMTEADAPRFDLSRSYVMAIEWQPARCTAGDKVPGQWRGLGVDSSMPYETGMLGQGELMGRQVSATERLKKLDPTDPNFSLEDQMVGKSLTDLQTVLESAKPLTKESFGPPPAPCPASS